MIVIRQKEFNSKAQKERRTKWETQSQSRPSQKDIDRQMKDPRSTLEKKLDSELGIKDNPRYNKTEGQAIEAAKKNNFRYDNKFVGGDPLTIDKSKSRRRLAIIFGKHPDRPNTGLYRKEAIEDFKKGLRDAPGASERKKALIERADNYEREKEAARKAKAKASAESIAKHEAKAAELRAKKVAGQKLVKNLKTAGKVGIGVAGAAGIGYGIKKAVDKNKKENGKEK